MTLNVSTKLLYLLLLYLSAILYSVFTVTFLKQSVSTAHSVGAVMYLQTVLKYNVI